MFATGIWIELDWSQWVHYFVFFVTLILLFLCIQFTRYLFRSANLFMGSRWLIIRLFKALVSRRSLTYVILLTSMPFSVSLLIGGVDVLVASLVI